MYKDGMEHAGSKFYSSDSHAFFIPKMDPCLPQFRCAMNGADTGKVLTIAFQVAF